MNSTHSASPASTPGGDDIPGVARVTPVAAPAASSTGGSGTATPHTRPPLPSSTILAELVGKLVGAVARFLSPEFVERSLAGARSVGQYAVLTGGVLTLLYAIFAAIKFNSFAVFLAGLGMIAAIAVAQFAGTRFLDAADRMIESTPGRINSLAFLECTGLLVLLLAAATLVGGITASIKLGGIAPLVPAVIIAAALGYFGAITLHPRLVNAEWGSATAGEEAIGLLSFFIKAGLKLVPLFFCLLAVAGALAIAASFFQAGQSLAATLGSVVQLLPIPGDLPTGLTGSALVVLACVLLLVSYFIFLLQHLMLDVLRAILCVPGKLDALRRSQ